MLRLKRLKKDPSVSIQIRERNTFLDGSFKKALLMSFAIHIVVFGLFKVKFIEIQEIKDNVLPVEVAIEGNTSDDYLATTQVSSQEEKILFPIALPKITLQNQVIEEVEDKSLISFLLNHSLSSYSTNYDYMEIEDSRASFFQGLEKQSVSFKRHYYPLKIALSHALEKYELLEDGRLLFKEKDNEEIKTKPTTIHKIIYGVKISGESGKVIEWRYKTNLKDKILQATGDKLIQLITFAPFSKKHAKGTIEFSFECDGNELKHYIEASF